MGAATAARLTADGHRVIGVDLRDADVLADLGTAEGRAAAVAAVTDAAGGVLDGLVTFAGLGPLPGRSGALVASVNYFGTIALLEGLPPLLGPRQQRLGGGDQLELHHLPTRNPGSARRCVRLANDEDAARELGEAGGSLLAYPSSKTGDRPLRAPQRHHPRLDRCRHPAQRDRTRTHRHSAGGGGHGRRGDEAAARAVPDPSRAAGQAGGTRRPRDVPA